MKIKVNITVTKKFQIKKGEQRTAGKVEQFWDGSLVRKM